jgi:hypothetical protein
METETNHIQDVINPAASGTSHQGSHHTGPTKARRFGRKKLAVLVALLILLAFGVFWSWWLFGRNTSFDENTAIKKGQFQAVFLTNGQVYFGKLADLNHKYVTLTDIYYLQVQQTNGSLQNASGNANSDSSVSLAKLGSELHGPEDKMSVSSEQVLFWENLKNDSKVVQAIHKYQNQ